MELAAKLQVKSGSAVAVLGCPPKVRRSLPRDCRVVSDPDAADAVVAFLTPAADLDATAEPALAATGVDRLAWIAYPKGGQLDTDLNRYRPAAAVRAQGAQPVRQVSIDAVWSALRVRPATSALDGR